MAATRFGVLPKANFRLWLRGCLWHNLKFM